MKKLTALCLSVLLLFSCLALTANAAEDPETKTLRFGEDGKFRIMMLNDFQDEDKADARSVYYLNRMLDTVQPDLVVLVGDQLEPGNHLTKSEIKTALNNILQPINDRRIPFLFTFGNHDHDHDARLSSQEQANIYNSYAYGFSGTDGCDPGTYNKIVYGSDGVTPKFNIYMMDTNDRDEITWCGVEPYQVAWYKETSDALKTLNGGEILPSILFQHIPVKEIYNLLTAVPQGTPGAVQKTASFPGDFWWIMNDQKMISTDNLMGEAPGSEYFGKTTGQYEAWLEKGDIVYGAYFGHDHVNDFVGVTDEGVRMGYNAGFGYATYGPGEQRAVKIFDFDENDLSDVTISRLRFCDLPNTGDAPTSGSESFFARLWQKIVAFFRSLLGQLKAMF